jgi:hypothetical protein
VLANLEKPAKKHLQNVGCIHFDKCDDVYSKVWKIKPTSMLLNDLDPVTICRFIIAILDKRFQKLFTLFIEIRLFGHDWMTMKDSDMMSCPIVDNSWAVADELIRREEIEEQQHKWLFLFVQ